jgi:hypothetical protein
VLNIIFIILLEIIKMKGPTKTKTTSLYWSSMPVIKNEKNIDNRHNISIILDRPQLVKSLLIPINNENNPNVSNFLVNVNLYETEATNYQKYMSQILVFINENYKRGTESDYHINYDSDRLRWEMGNIFPKYTGFIICLEKLENSENILGLIGYSPKIASLYEINTILLEPVYLCCLRNSNVAQKLINEVIKYGLLNGFNEGVIANNRETFKPLSTYRQYSRPINYKKLREHDFVDVEGVEDDVVHNKMLIKLNPNKKYKFAENTNYNISIVNELYNEYMNSFSFSRKLSKKEIENYFFNNEYVRTYFIYNNNGNIVDFVSYNFYNLHNNNCDELLPTDPIYAANLLMYTANKTRPDVILINLLKQLNKDKIDILYLNDMMHSNEFILSNIKSSDIDTEPEEQDAFYDNYIIKTSKKTFIQLFNRNYQPMMQNMSSWILF